jgi:hypothetical protein
MNTLVTYFSNQTPIWFLAQSLGLVACAVGLTAFAQTDEKRFKLQLLCFVAVLTVHYYFLDAQIAMISCFLNLIRTITSMKTRDIRFAYFFIALNLAFTLPRLKHFIEFLPIIGTCTTTYMMFIGTNLKTRIGFFCSSCLWLIHNIWALSIGGMIVEFTFAIVNGRNIYKFYQLQKQGINPFSEMDIR